MNGFLIRLTDRVLHYIEGTDCVQYELLSLLTALTSGNLENFSTSPLSSCSVYFTDPKGYILGDSLIVKSPLSSPSSPGFFLDLNSSQSVFLSTHITSHIKDQKVSLEPVSQSIGIYCVTSLEASPIGEEGSEHTWDENEEQPISFVDPRARALGVRTYAIEGTFEVADSLTGADNLIFNLIRVFNGVPQGKTVENISYMQMKNVVPFILGPPQDKSLEAVDYNFNVSLVGTRVIDEGERDTGEIIENIHNIGLLLTSSPAKSFRISQNIILSVLTP